MTHAHRMFLDCPVYLECRPLGSCIQLYFPRHLHYSDIAPLQSPRGTDWDVTPCIHPCSATSVLGLMTSPALIVCVCAAPLPVADCVGYAKPCAMCTLACVCGSLCSLAGRISGICSHRCCCADAALQGGSSSFWRSHTCALWHHFVLLIHW